jgi:hypothetical protein
MVLGEQPLLGQRTGSFGMNDVLALNRQSQIVTNAAAAHAGDVVNHCQGCHDRRS